MKLETEIADFVVKYSDGIYEAEDHKQIELYARVHMDFGTLIIVRRDKKIIAVCRWNWISSDELKVLDLVIHPEFRHKQVARDILLNAKRALPQLKRISFQRKKYAMRASGIDVARWLKEKENVREIATQSN